MAIVHVSLMAIAPQYGTGDPVPQSTHIDSHTASTGTGAQPEVSVTQVPASNADSGTTEFLHKVWRIANAGPEDIIVRFDTAGGSAVLANGTNGFMVLADSVETFKVTNSDHIARIINYA